jgi:hypothetical protein
MLIQLTTEAGKPLVFEDVVIGQGAMKDVYLTVDQRFAVAFYRNMVTEATVERLEKIVGTYRENIFGNVGADSWRELFCWPEDLVVWNGKLGLVMPVYPEHFKFEFGSNEQDRLGIRGREKEGKWFVSAHHRKNFLDRREWGDWRRMLQVCHQLARALRRLHAAGLAHADLSYKNVLVDPLSGRAAMIDLDGLVVPGKYPPEVIGTPDFIAPEVMQTRSLGAAERVLPSRVTDLHALSVLIYMYLLNRHPLRGAKFHHEDLEKDEELAMGAQALWIEDPLDPSNRPDLEDARPADVFWWDVQKLPAGICGPYLYPLMQTAFGPALHQPKLRPSADDWEHALGKTQDLLLPCSHTHCEQKWFVYDQSTQPQCPFCGTPYGRELPVLNFYSSRDGTQFKPENHRMVLYAGQSIHLWHAEALCPAFERLSAQEREPVSTIREVSGRLWWWNGSLKDLNVKEEGVSRAISLGESFELKAGQQILLSRASGGRVMLVQMTGS